LSLTMRSFKGWRARLLLFLLILAGGVVFGVFASGAAGADDPPPTTVATPTLPTPVPAPTTPSPPPQKPPPQKPPPRRSKPPPQGTSTTHSTPHIATQTQPAAPSPANATPAVVSRPTRAQHKRAHARAAIRRERSAPATPVKARQRLGAPVGFLTQPKARSGNPFDVSSLLVILGCALACTCLLIALVPATAVPWRPIAIFISQRQLDLTLVGIALLGATLMIYVMNRF
jgi:hypothetical protein